MAGLKPFRIMPESAIEWSRWCADQNLHTDNNSTFTGAVTGSNILRGTVAPEDKVTGSPGDLYCNTLGGTSLTLYVKESGVGTKQGWVAK